MNLHHYGKPFAKELKKTRKHSRKILANFIRCADKDLSQGSHVASEWSKTCEGWDLPELVRFIKRHGLFVAEQQGCACFVTRKVNVIQRCGKSKPLRGDLLKASTEPSAATRMSTSVRLSKTVGHLWQGAFLIPCTLGLMQRRRCLSADAGGTMR